MYRDGGGSRRRPHLLAVAICAGDQVRKVEHNICWMFVALVERCNAATSNSPTCRSDIPVIAVRIMISCMVVAVMVKFRMVVSVGVHDAGIRAGQQVKRECSGHSEHQHRSPEHSGPTKAMKCRLCQQTRLLKACSPLLYSHCAVNAAANLVVLLLYFFFTVTPGSLLSICGETVAPRLIGMSFWR